MTITVGKCCAIVAVALVAVGVIVYVIWLGLSHTSDDDTDTNSSESRAVPTLKFMVVVSRHGNRGSTFDYPDDPYPTNDTNYWPYGVDGLTPRGRNQMFRLGVKVRSLYSGFIPATYLSDDMRASSTYLDRLMMSGEAFLAGLYPPKGSQVWNEDLAWQPTAIYSDSPDRTVDLLNDVCTYFQTNFINAIYEINDKYADTMSVVREYVLNATGVNTTGTLLGTEIGFVMWDKLSSEENEEFDLPEWTKAFYPEIFYDFVRDEYMVGWAGSVNILRIVAGELFEEILDAMVQKINGTLTPDRMIYYYSGHDSTIIALQRILGVPDDSVVGIVKPGSALVIELHQNNETQQYYLEALYLDGTQLHKEPLSLNITSDFDLLFNNTQKYLNVNYAQECEEQTTIYT